MLLLAVLNYLTIQLRKYQRYNVYHRLFIRLQLLNAHRNYAFKFMNTTDDVEVSSQARLFVDPSAYRWAVGNSPLLLVRPCRQNSGQFNLL